MKNRILLAKSAGFCFGVTKAIDMVDKIAKNTTQHIYTYGPIIHNHQVVKNLESKGIYSCEEIDDIILPAKLVIRAHGVPPIVYDNLKKKDVQIFDATCPYVRKIHKLVEKKSSSGDKILIIGDEGHPEVIGIKGWCCNEAIVINGIEIEKIDKIKNEKICVVAQTTLSYEKWTEITKFLRNYIKDIDIFDTICSATSKRQKESEEISKKVDIMFIIGSNNSSNTQKLYEICKKHCHLTYKIETALELDLDIIKDKQKIGVTAGASTPDWIIEEVINKMSTLDKKTDDMDFGRFFEESLVSLSNGDVVTGTIIGFNNNEVFVDLGFKSDGIIPSSEFTDGNNLKDFIQVGQEVEVLVLRVNDADGNVLLSKKKAEAMKAWGKVNDFFVNKIEIKAKATDVVKGGITANWMGLRIFVPASQISNKFIKDLKSIIGTELRLRIIEFNEKNRRLVGSQRVILEEENVTSQSSVWDTIELNKKYEGTVKNITDFGAFVDVGGVDGLIHISDLSWKKLKHPSEVVNVGETVNVIVKDFDTNKKKISFILKKSEDDPWIVMANKLNVGDVFEVKVLRLVPFGVFVEIVPGIEGLVHISQISEKRIGKPSDVLTEDQKVKAKIIEVNIENKKISLSIKEVEPINPPEKEGQVIIESAE
jgi:4-hydroxy-3-methylbut-2-enyl diphosphate reductase